MMARVFRRALCLLAALCMAAGPALGELREEAPLLPSLMEERPLRPVEAPGTTAAPEKKDTMALAPEGQPLRRAVIRAVGDVMSHDKQLEIALQPDGTYDYHPQYAYVVDCLAAADYTIANLETTVGQYRGTAYSGFPMFNAPEALLDALKDAGVDFLTMANNHMLDRYFDGMCQTVDLVEAHGFDHGGANRTQAEHDAPVIEEVNGIKIGFLCCTTMTNGMEYACVKEARTVGVTYVQDLDWPAEVEKLRAAGAEVVIAIPHWDAEYQRQPGAATVAWARKLVAAGVDVIIGSHPHVVQPIEYVTAEGPDGQPRTGLVAYSLGNFCSNQSRQYTDAGIIFQFTLLEDQDGSIRVTDPAFVPTFCWHQFGTIATLPALKYRDDPPREMVEWRVQRLRASIQELRTLIGEDIAMLEE